MSSTATGVPSAYLRFGCSLNVQVSPSGDVVPRSVRSGTRTGLPSRTSYCVGVRYSSFAISFESV
jgi:hypothetical protein